MFANSLYNVSPINGNIIIFPFVAMLDFFVSSESNKHPTSNHQTCKATIKPQLGIISRLINEQTDHQWHNLTSFQTRQTCVL
jgi:hypothetical protein